MPTAVTTGLVLIAAFLGAIMWRPAAVMLIVLAVVGLAGVEFFSKVTEKGYRPAAFAGLITCIAAPLAAYWAGIDALPLVLAFGFLATSIGFLGASSIQSGPMPNVAITTMAMTWIGLMGAFAGLILRTSTLGGTIPQHAGTDTLFMVVIAVIANDVGGLFVGSSVGRTPLREWVSPNKTIEGAVGGALASIVALMLVGSQNGTWNSMGEWIALGLVVAVMAPLGDLVESMFKRNLDVKDFGSIVAGHGGVLDRFDGFLFVLPSAYYLMKVLVPWQ
jgi:phosphatidate cytidylyltransferase